MAVEVEDYETAAVLKKEIEQMRSIAYSNIPDYPEMSGSRTPSPSELLSPRLAEQVVNPGYFQDFRQGPLSHTASAEALMFGDAPKKHKDYVQDFGLPRVSSIPNSFEKQSRQSQGNYDSRLGPPSLSPLSISAYDPRSSTSHFPSSHSSSTSSASSFSLDQRPIASSYPHLTNSNPPMPNPPQDTSFGNDFMRASAHEFGRASVQQSNDPSDASAETQGLPRQTSAKDVPKNAYEDRPLPTAKYGFGNETPRNQEFDNPVIEDRPIKAKDNSRNHNDKKAAVLDDDEPPQVPKDAVHLVEIFGEENVLGLYAPAWAGREQALKSIETSLPIKTTDSDTAFRSLCSVLTRSFADKIPQIYLAALSLLQAVLLEYGEELRGPVLRSHLSTLLPNITVKTADNNTRLRDNSFLALLSFAQHPNIGPNLIGSHVAKPAKNQAQWKLILGRIGVLIEMIPVFGLSDSHSHPIEDEPLPGLECDMVCNFICSAFDSANSDVRSAAVQAIAEVYRINPQKALQTTTGVKPKLLELIKIAFKEADEQRGEQPPPVQYDKKSPRVDSGASKPAKGKSQSAATDAKPPAKSNKQQPETKTSKESKETKQTQQTQPTQQKQAPKQQPQQTQPPQQQQQQKQTKSNNNHSTPAPAPSLSPSPIPNHSNHNHTEHDEPESFQVYTNENSRCQFCGLEDENFTEDLLDQHYMRDCVMLCECDCEQVIEISCLNEHQLTECDNAPHRAACPNCKMALPDFDLEAHIAECPANWAQATWTQCPLCFSPAPLQSSKQWFLHLSKECPNNPRNDLAASTY